MILVLSVYWTTDRVRFERLWLSLLPVEHRAQARDIWRDIDSNIGAYLRSELIQSVLAGLLLGSGYWLMGLKYPVVLALAGTIAWFIPVLGALLALIPVVWVGLTGSLSMAVGAAVYTLVISIVLEWLVEPNFFNRQRFSRLLQVLIMIAFIDALGLVGLLIAPPVAIAVQILFGQLLQQQLPMLAGKTIPELADLQQRVAKIRSLLTTSEIEPSPQIISMLERLDHLLDEANHTTLSEPSPESPQEINPGPVQIIQQPVQ
jgi:predicted PurR-regulated permease PerM